MSPLLDLSGIRSFANDLSAEFPGTTFALVLNSQTQQMRPPVRPSAPFAICLAAFVASAGFCVSGINRGLATFAFVASGWVLSLILHEFAHAYTAFVHGDVTVAAKGYLDLDPRRYTDPFLSLGLPIFFVLAGGIGLPGGAVWINRSLLRSKAGASLVSLAGPAVNASLAIVLVAVSNTLIDPASQPVLAQAIAFLAFLQVTAFVLNMLPIPGLDGFGALEPHLSEDILRAVAPIRQYGLMILFVLLWFVDPVNDAFWSIVGGMLDLFGVDGGLWRRGYLDFRFWER